MTDINQTSKKNEEKPSIFSRFFTLIDNKIGIITLVISIVVVLIGDNLLIRACTPNSVNNMPQISLVTPVVSLKSKVFLFSEDTTFFTSRNLNIEFEGLKFHGLAKPIEGYVKQYWYFSLDDKRIPRDLITSGIKTLSVSFPGSRDRVDMNLYLTDSVDFNFFIPKSSRQTLVSKSDFSSIDTLYDKIFKVVKNHFSSKKNTSIKLLPANDSLKFEVFTTMEVYFNPPKPLLEKLILGKKSELSPRELLIFTFFSNKSKKQLYLTIDGYFGSFLSGRFNRNRFLKMEEFIPYEINQYRKAWREKLLLSQ